MAIRLLTIAPIAKVFPQSSAFIVLSVTSSSSSTRIAGWRKRDPVRMFM